MRDKTILGLTRVDALGAIQLAGPTLAVEISDLLEGGFPRFVLIRCNNDIPGFQTTPGLTELAPSMVDVEIKQQQQLSCL